MGLPEDKVKLFDDNPKTTPPTTVVDENEEDFDCCQFIMCMSLVFLVVFGVFLGLVVFPSSHNDEDLNYEQGLLYLNIILFFSFNLPLAAYKLIIILGLVSRTFAC